MLHEIVHQDTWVAFVCLWLLAESSPRDGVCEENGSEKSEELQRHTPERAPEKSSVGASSKHDPSILTGIEQRTPERVTTGGTYGMKS